jgi:hypothetical protein
MIFSHAKNTSLIYLLIYLQLGTSVLSYSRHRFRKIRKYYLLGSSSL